MVAVGLVITFVGLGEKGFRTTELKLMGPCLVGGGVMLTLLRILLCTAAPACARQYNYCCVEQEKYEENIGQEKCFKSVGKEKCFKCVSKEKSKESIGQEKCEECVGQEKYKDSICHEKIKEIASQEKCKKSVVE